MSLELVQKRVKELMQDKDDIFQSTANPLGYLLKAGEGGLFSSSAFKKRHFRYNNTLSTLSYFADQDATKAKGTIAMDKITSVELLNGKDDRIVFKLHTPARIFTLAAETEEMLAQWVAKLTKIVNATETDKTALASMKKQSSSGRRKSFISRLTSGKYSKRRCEQM